LCVTHHFCKTYSTRPIGIHLSRQISGAMP
jgi:hypothetical protein